MKNDLVQEIQKTIQAGMRSNAELSYLFVLIRKVLEGDSGESLNYEFLKFYCDWLLHIKMTKSSAKKIIKHFVIIDEVIRRGLPTIEVPSDTRVYIDGLSKLYFLRKELERFLKVHELPNFIEKNQPWLQFMIHYLQIVKNSPLKVKAKNEETEKTIAIEVEFPEGILDDQKAIQIHWVFSNGYTNPGGTYTVTNLYPKEFELDHQKV